MNVFGGNSLPVSRHFPAGNTGKREVKSTQLIDFIEKEFPASRHFPVIDREVEVIVFIGFFRVSRFPGFPIINNNTDSQSNDVTIKYT